MLTSPGQAAVFMPDSPADVLWRGDCDQLCLMIDRTALDGALEVLLGHPVTRPIEFASRMDCTSREGARWLDLLRAFRNRFDDPSRFPSSGPHLEQLVLRGLLFAQPHEHLDELTAWRPPSSPRSVRQAIDLMEGRPEHTWSTGELARSVFVSPRSLQEAFRRSVGGTPMTCLRDIRLDRVHAQLSAANPSVTSVTDVAVHLGFAHLGRFASAYRRRFGRAPSETLRSP